MQSSGPNHLSADSIPARDDRPDDPWQAPQHDVAAARLPWLNRLLAAAVGVIVTLSAAATLVAFLFGLLVALFGQNQPGQLDPWQTISQGSGRWLFLAGIALTACASLFLGVFAWLKILAVWQRQQLHLQRRQQLQHAVGHYRQARTQAAHNVPTEPSRVDDVEAL